MNFWEKAAACHKLCRHKKETSLCSVSLTFMPSDRGELNLVTQTANKDEDFLKVQKSFAADWMIKAAQPAESNVQMVLTGSRVQCSFKKKVLFNY